MLLTVTCTHPPATDLGYLLHKHPDRVHTVDLAFGQAHVFYPEAGRERCTAALVLEVDPVRLVRGRGGSDRDMGAAAEYVNDRPYVASSLLSVALAEAYSSALSGRSRERPELAETPLPLRARIAVLPCRGGERLLRCLFEPLGYAVTARRHALDEHFPEWGESPYYTVELDGTARLRDLLRHLYVLMPVLDDEKHYYVGEAEVEKLLRRGEGWLETHPERDEIARRYLVRRRSLVRLALDRLVREEAPDADAAEEAHAGAEAAIESRLRLAEERVQAVIRVLEEAEAKRVVDLGCGEGRLLRALHKRRSFEEIVGVDVSHRALERAADALRLERLGPTERQRIRLVHGSLVYRDRRLEGFDAAVAIEVIEHLDPPRLAAFERVLFEKAAPRLVVLTTPNVEYNVRFATLPAGRFRHADHRFEWTRAEFLSWAEGVAARFGYQASFLPVGEVDAEVGAPTQMGVFRRGLGRAPEIALAAPAAGAS